MIEILKAESVNDEFKPPLEAFELSDGGNLSMVCIFELRNNKVEIFDIKEVDESPFMFYDAMIRSVMAYGVESGAGSICCRNKSLFEKLSKLGFTYSDDQKNRMFADAQNVLKHNCK